MGFRFPNSEAFINPSVLAGDHIALLDSTFVLASFDTPKEFKLSQVIFFKRNSLFDSPPWDQCFNSFIALLEIYEWSLNESIACQ